MLGHLDQVTLRRVRGWASEQDGRPVDVTVYLNDVQVATIRPSNVRPDISLLPRNDVGFDVELPRPADVGDVVSVTNSKSEHLIGSPHRVTVINASKEEKALWSVTNDMKILEIGPAYSPIAPRSAGWNSFSLDHATQEELQKKYAAQQATERIEPVDYLWKGGPIETAIPTPEHGTFDAIIASHVIEHIPNPIGFFHSAAKLLKANGLVSLVIPDKRWTFDFFKPLTVTSDYLYSHHLGRTRHSKKTAFDNVAYNVKEQGDIAWSLRVMRNFEFIGNDMLFQARDVFEKIVEDESGPYVDFHATVYTPSSFSLIILELSAMGVLPFRVERRFPTSGCEFYVTLRKGTPVSSSPHQVDDQRRRLLLDIVRESAQQARWLLDERSGEI